jgi:hypothetical protein
LSLSGERRINHRRKEHFVPWNDFWTLFWQSLIFIPSVGIVSAIAVYFITSAISSGIKVGREGSPKPEKLTGEKVL